jgi:hypothetical protein
MNNFTLQPFSTANPVPEIEISGTIDRQDHLLSIEYQLRGNLKTIEIADPVVTPTRKFALWEATCFEFFLGVTGASDYWEFNLSPSGDWNIFHLNDYRQGLRDELAFTVLPMQIDRQPNLLSLALAFDLSKIIAIEQSIETSVTTVIKTDQGQISYWALTHCGTEADFHRRDSFTMKIESQSRSN